MKAETKDHPHRTDGEGQGRVTAETVVAEGKAGLERMKDLVRRVVHVRPPPEAGE